MSVCKYDVEQKSAKFIYGVQDVCHILSTSHSMGNMDAPRASSGSLFREAVESPAKTSFRRSPSPLRPLDRVAGTWSRSSWRCGRQGGAKRLKRRNRWGRVVVVLAVLGYLGVLLFRLD